MHKTSLFQSEQLDSEQRLVAALDCYFVQESGERFKVSLPYQPYFYVAAAPGHDAEVSAYLAKKFVGVVARVELVDREDLDLVRLIVLFFYLKLTTPLHAGGPPGGPPPTLHQALVPQRARPQEGQARTHAAGAQKSRACGEP